MKNKIKQKGVALLIVLSSIMLLSALVVEFAYQSNVTYNISMNEKERMEAYYLALSAINFSRIVIKYNKEAQQLVSQASQGLGRSIQVQPLYKMIPINTAIIRGLLQASGGAKALLRNHPLRMKIRREEKNRMSWKLQNKACQQSMRKRRKAF